MTDVEFQCCTLNLTNVNKAKKNKSIVVPQLISGNSFISASIIETAFAHLLTGAGAVLCGMGFHPRILNQNADLMQVTTEPGHGSRTICAKQTCWYLVASRAL